MRIIWRTQALADLRALRGYIARHNASAADRTAEHIRQAVMQLATFPHQGRPGRRLSTCELVVTGTPYFMVYRVREDTVRILRVLHGRQRWPLP